MRIRKLIAAVLLAAGWVAAVPAATLVVKDPASLTQVLAKARTDRRIERTNWPTGWACCCGPRFR